MGWDGMLRKFNILCPCMTFSDTLRSRQVTFMNHTCNCALCGLPFIGPKRAFKCLT